MVIEDDYYEVMELMNSMILFVFRELEERKQYRDLIEIVKKHYPTTRKFRVGLDKHGKVPCITFVEAKRLLREEIGMNADDSKDLS